MDSVSGIPWHSTACYVTVKPIALKTDKEAAHQEVALLDISKL